MCSSYRLNAGIAAFRLKILAVLLLVFTCLFSVVTAGYAETYEEEELAVLRGVIVDQIKAFQRDDAEAAYEFSSPGIQALFPTPETFMAMIRRSYQTVYRAEKFFFEDVAIIDGRTIQPLRIIPDGAGSPTMAMYIMEQQSDGAWKIGGCILLKDDDLFI